MLYNINDFKFNIMTIFLNIISYILCINIVIAFILTLIALFIDNDKLMDFVVFILLLIEGICLIGLILSILLC